LDGFFIHSTTTPWFLLAGRAVYGPVKALGVPTAS
jgi:hypothetical protein